MTGRGAASPGRARLAGVLYLGTIVCGLFAELGSRDALIVDDDAAATAQALLAHAALFRSGIVADLAMLACYLGVTALFHDLFRAVDRGVSQIAAVFSLTGIAVLASNTLLLLAPLRLLGGSAFLAPLGLAQRQAAALLCLRLHADGYAVGLVFFGGYCALLGWLIWRSGFLPRAIGALMGLAGFCYLLNSLSGLAAPGLARALSPHLMDPTLLGEAALAVWLVARGVKAGPVAGGAGRGAAV